MDYLSYFLTSFATLFVIVDPPGNIPFFIALTEDLPVELREKVSKKATAIAATLLTFIALTGGLILQFFGVSIDGLRIAGGILLFLVALDILKGGPAKEVYVKRGMESKDIDSLAVFPIALPLYTGPGAITAAIVLASEAGNVLGMALLLLSIAAIYLIVRLTHIYSNQIIYLLGKSGADIVARVMAIFLAAIAVEYISEGISGKLSSML
ncbi:NAAT family transporter [Archaeoglobus veneficus]|uniref:UPF0056 membrane protein n=1 Tax=Archaeoglobus veneficus (strain DSM 11195 / SNP6) TaxID=693661 RepID=F2KQL9_ARCVS|nr:NAAT family transporter [Archaeoglobus veneficus]AEA47752.1 multiple antibiotic resistance (MarC)-related protein [Archaeoglobus veneficus SNP6]